MAAVGHQSNALRSGDDATRTGPFRVGQSRFLSGRPVRHARRHAKLGDSRQDQDRGGTAPTATLCDNSGCKSIAVRSATDRAVGPSDPRLSHSRRHFRSAPGEPRPKPLCRPNIAPESVSPSCHAKWGAASSPASMRLQLAGSRDLPGRKNRYHFRYRGAGAVSAAPQPHGSSGGEDAVGPVWRSPPWRPRSSQARLARLLCALPILDSTGARKHTYEPTVLGAQRKLR